MMKSRLPVFLLFAFSLHLSAQDKRIVEDSAALTFKDTILFLSGFPE